MKTETPASRHTRASNNDGDQISLFSSIRI